MTAVRDVRKRWAEFVLTETEPLAPPKRMYEPRFDAETGHKVAEALLGRECAHCGHARSVQQIADEFGLTHNQIRTVERQLHVLGGTA